jgi:hypothetical protein
MFNLPHHIMSTIPQDGHSVINSIVRELEKIPEPMQLSVLAYIHSIDVSATPDHPAELPPRILGLNRGAMKMRDDFDEPLPDEFWLNEE